MTTIDNTHALSQHVIDQLGRLLTRGVLAQARWDDPDNDKAQDEAAANAVDTALANIVTLLGTALVKPSMKAQDIEAAVPVATSTINAVACQYAELDPATLTDYLAFADQAMSEIVTAFTERAEQRAQADAIVAHARVERAQDRSMNSYDQSDVEQAQTTLEQYVDGEGNLTETLFTVEQLAKDYIARSHKALQMPVAIRKVQDKLTDMANDRDFRIGGAVQLHLDEPQTLNPMVVFVSLSTGSANYKPGESEAWAIAYYPANTYPAKNTGELLPSTFDREGYSHVIRSFRFVDDAAQAQRELRSAVAVWQRARRTELADEPTEDRPLLNGGRAQVSVV